MKVFFSTIKQEQLPNEVPLVLWEGARGASTFTSLEAAVERPRPAPRAASRAAPRGLPCFPAGARDNRGLTGSFLSFAGGRSAWLSLGFESSLCAFEMDVCLT